MSKTTIHIGHGKSGSTFLQLWFRSHPNIFPIALGQAWQPTYIEAEAKKSAKPSLSNTRYVLSDENLCAWYPPRAYYDLPDSNFDERDHIREVAVGLRDIYPKARILLILRGFREVLASNYSEYIKLGGPLGAEAFWPAYQPFFRFVYDYDYLFSTYCDLFGAGRVLVLPYEAMRDDQESFLETVSAWVGVEPHKIPKERINPSLSDEELLAYPKISRWMASFSNRLINQTAKNTLWHWHLKNLRLNRYRYATKFVFTKQETIDIPDGILRQFSECAKLIAQIDCFSPYLDNYLQ